MAHEVKVPILPESVVDATVSKWYKKVGDTVSREENLVDLETDKIMLEVPAPCSGVVQSIAVTEGSVVTPETVIAIITEGAVADTASAPAVAADAAPAVSSASMTDASPAVRRLLTANNLQAADIVGSGKGGRLTVADVDAYLAKGPSASTPAAPAASVTEPAMGQRTEKRVPMSRLRQRIAERLVQVQHEAAILTTFNEVDMAPVMALRSKYKKQFEATHGVKLGFMSFFAKAVVAALKAFPAVNASIDGTDVLYHNYCDLGVAIGSERGLVVPIVRNAECMSMAEIELKIREYAVKAKDGKLGMDEITGGTFSITNGGTFGSMLSTPIINPPQTAILGMHNIVERAMVVDGQVVVRPVMYLALSYDHRVVDGREAVLFLVRIKQLLEDPAAFMLDV